MLSPHEFAALMLIEGMPELNGAELSPDNLAALVEQQLIRLESPASGHVRPSLTREGQSLLQRVRGHRRAAD